MPPKTLLLGITVLAVVIIIGGVAYTLVEEQILPTPSSGNGQQTPTDNTTPETQPQYTEDNSSAILPEPASPEGSTDTNGTNTPSTGAASVQEQVRDQGMTYLRTSKSETAPLMGNLSWYGGRYDLSPPGTEQYMYYTSDNFWSVTVESQTDSAGNFTITGTYFNAATMTVTFKEKYVNGVFTLINYSSQRNIAPLPP
jgi:hypothetical protein